MPAQIEKKELLEAIRKDGPRKVVQQYRHNLLPSRVLIELYGDNPERDVLLFLALYPTVPSQVLEDLTEAYPDPEILAAAALNPRCSHLLLVRMAREGGAPVRAALAANKQQNTKITANLLNDPNLFVRAALAGNGTIGQSFKYALAQDPEPCVRTALSLSGKLTDELAHALSSDDSAVVRAAVYGVAKVEDGLLLGWARSDDTEAQRLMLSRNNLSDAMIQALCLSVDPLVQEQAGARHTPTAAEWLAKAESDIESQRLEAAQFEGLPTEIQHLLANDPNVEVRKALASNPALDEKVALWFAASNDAASCEALAGNPALTDPVKTELCHHEQEEIRLRMAYRDDLTEEQLGILVNERDSLNIIAHLALLNVRFAGTAAERVDQLLAHKRPSLHAFATASAQLSDSQVRKLMRHDSASVRLALCDNPILTRTALEELARDWNEAVADAATERLNNFTDLEEDQPDDDSDAADNPDRGLVTRIVEFFK